MKSLSRSTITSVGETLSWICCDASCLTAPVAAAPTAGEGGNARQEARGIDRLDDMVLEARRQGGASFRASARSLPFENDTLWDKSFNGIGHVRKP